MNLPTVSIIIPAYNEQESIRQCIDACLVQTVAPLEIIVVDNKSKDSTAEIVQEMQKAHPEANIIYTQQFKKQGLIPTRNFGLNFAQGDVLGRIDADSKLDPHWVAEVQKGFADPELMAATGPVSYYDMPGGVAAMKADNAIRKGILKITKQYHFVFGSNMAIRRSAWRIIQNEVCLDEADLFHEDIDLSIHLGQHNLKVEYLPKMTAGMSARRIEDKPRDFLFYIRRFSRTYKAHNISNPALRIPMYVLLSIYFPAKLMRKMSKKKQNAKADSGE